MDAEEEKTQRQRFYIELKPGETTIISWKKLLREAKEKDQRGPHTSSSSVHETRWKAMDGNCDGDQHSAIRHKRAKDVNRDTVSGYMQPTKCRVELTKREGEKNDGHSSIKHAGSENLSTKDSTKTSSRFDETFRGCSSPGVVKNRQPEELRAFTVIAPFLTYSKKSRCTPLNAIEEKIKGVGGESSGVMHQNFEGRYNPVNNSSTSGTVLHDKVSSESRHKDWNGGIWGFVDAFSSGYKSPLKDSYAELWPEGVMAHRTLTEAILRERSRKTIVDNNLSQNLVDDVKRNPDRISFQKRNVNDSSNNCNPIPSLPSKTAPKKVTVEHPVLKIKSSPPAKSVKLTVKQKQPVQEKPNVKVRFLLKQEHETLKSNEQAAKDTLTHSRAAATLSCNQPT